MVRGLRSVLTAEVVDFFFLVFLSVSVLRVCDYKIPSPLPACKKIQRSPSLSLTASVPTQHTQGDLSTKGMVSPSE